MYFLCSKCGYEMWIPLNPPPIVIYKNDKMIIPKIVLTINKIQSKCKCYDAYIIPKVINIKPIEDKRNIKLINDIKDICSKYALFRFFQKKSSKMVLLDTLKIDDINKYYIEFTLKNYKNTNISTLKSIYDNKPELFSHWMLLKDFNRICLNYNKIF